MPLSETIIWGLPRASMSVVSSRATRLPEIDVSGLPPDVRVSRHPDIADAEAAAQGELIVHEVERPARIDLRPGPGWCACSDGPPPRLALADCQPFLPVEPIDAIDA